MNEREDGTTHLTNNIQEVKLSYLVQETLKLYERVFAHVNEHQNIIFQNQYQSQTTTSASNTYPGRTGTLRVSWSTFCIFMIILNAHSKKTNIFFSSLSFDFVIFNPSKLSLVHLYPRVYFHWNLCLLYSTLISYHLSTHTFQLNLGTINSNAIPFSSLT